MRLAVMQPYFFPYIGYFALIKHSDLFVLLDTVQMIRRGWVSRNRILHPSSGWQYIRVALTGYSRGTLISNVRIDTGKDWQGLLLRQLDHYRKKAPYFHEVTAFLRDTLSCDTGALSHLNAHLLARTCGYIGIKNPLTLLSESGIAIEPVTAPDEWALNISKTCRAAVYINPPGGVTLYDRRKFAAAGVDLHFLRPAPVTYDQGKEIFEPVLSIIDVMMFNSPRSIRDMLDLWETIPADDNDMKLRRRGTPAYGETRNAESIGHTDIL